MSKEGWDWIRIVPEALKSVYDEMLAEAGVSVLFDSRVCQSVVKDGCTIRDVDIQRVQAIINRP